MEVCFLSNIIWVMGWRLTCLFEHCEFTSRHSTNVFAFSLWEADITIIFNLLYHLTPGCVWQISAIFFPAGSSELFSKFLAFSARHHNLSRLSFFFLLFWLAYLFIYLFIHSGKTILVLPVVSFTTEMHPLNSFVIVNIYIIMRTTTIPWGI